MKKIIQIYKSFLISSGISTDSRVEQKNKIFFALSGENFNGNKFAIEAIQKGSLLCVIDDPQFLTNNEKTILVDDALVALQELANYHRNKNNTRVLAITGSNGKTTTKELITSILRNHTDIISTHGNLNNHIGVPLTLLTIKPTTKIAVVEMGANHIGEIERLCEIAQPNIGIITNIGKAHLEGFGSFTGVIVAKNELYNYLRSYNGHVIVNNNDDLLNKLSEGIAITTYGKNNATIEGEIVSPYPTLKIRWGYNGIITQCNTQLYGNYNFNNILAAIATGIYFGVDEKTINESIEGYVSDNNRSQQIKTNANHIIMDAYNANPYSMVEAIKSFAQSDFENPWLLLGDMFELGEYASAEHQNIIDRLIEFDFVNVILIGEEFNSTKNHNYTKFISTDEVVQFLSSNKIENANILVKGSRGMKLEKLISRL